MPHRRARKIGGGRAELRRALYMPALTAARFNPDLKTVCDRSGQPDCPPRSRWSR
jgi:transposase